MTGAYFLVVGLPFFTIVERTNMIILRFGCRKSFKNLNSVTTAR